METNPGPRRPVPAVCRILCRNVRGLAGNLSDLTVASSKYGLVLLTLEFLPARLATLPDGLDSIVIQLLANM